MSTSVTPRQFVRVIETLDEKGLSSEQVQNDLLGKGILADIAEAIVHGTIPTREEFRKLLGLVTMVFRFIVDYTMSLSETIALGKYDCVSDNITEKKFLKPTLFAGVQQATQAVEAELLHFGSISSDSALANMKKQGFRPATIWELLAFGAKNPELQRQFPIVALGSSCFLLWERHVPILGGYFSGRGLYLYRFDDVWLGHFRFLVVRIKN